MSNAGLCQGLLKHLSSRLLPPHSRSLHLFIPCSEPHSLPRCHLLQVDPQWVCVGSSVPNCRLAYAGRGSSGWPVVLGRRKSWAGCFLDEGQISCVEMFGSVTDVPPIPLVPDVSPSASSGCQNAADVLVLAAWLEGPWTDHKL